MKPLAPQSFAKKGAVMKWDQIENRWAAMTRRVRPNLLSAANSDVAFARPRADVIGNDLVDTRESGRTDAQALASPSHPRE